MNDAQHLEAWEKFDVHARYDCACCDTCQAQLLSVMRQPLMVQVTQVSDERAEAESVIGLMQQLHQQGRHKWKDMAILYRTNAQSRLFEEQLVSCAMQL